VIVRKIRRSLHLKAEAVVLLPRKVAVVVLLPRRAAVVMVVFLLPKVAVASLLR
jgi:hypothetical protein